jgi:hypothetical protein
VLRVSALIFTAIGPVGLESNCSRLLKGLRRGVEVTLFARGRTEIDEERCELAVVRTESAGNDIDRLPKEAVPGSRAEGVSPCATRSVTATGPESRTAQRDFPKYRPYDDRPTIFVCVARSPAPSAQLACNCVRPASRLCAFWRVAPSQQRAGVVGYKT